MPKELRIEATRDPETKKWSAPCPEVGCNRVFVRSTESSALWNLSQHVAYTHDAQPVLTVEV